MPAAVIPTLIDGDVMLRAVRIKDARALDRVTTENRAWLQPWEATYPGGGLVIESRSSIRNLLAYARSGQGLPFVMEVDGELVGQLNVSGITHGSMSMATIGYWVAQSSAGRGVTPTATALATDYIFRNLRMHRVEICIRPENDRSIRVVEKLGFRYEGLRRRYIHIDGDWRDHYVFALVAEEVPGGVLQRWKDGRVPSAVAKVPEEDRLRATTPLRGEQLYGREPGSTDVTDFDQGAGSARGVGTGRHRRYGQNDNQKA